MLNLNLSNWIGFQIQKYESWDNSIKINLKQYGFK